MRKKAKTPIAVQVEPAPAVPAAGPYPPWTLQASLLAVVESELQLAAARALAVLPELTESGFALKAHEAFMRARRLRALVRVATAKKEGA